jgi:hypothetical protein
MAEVDPAREPDDVAFEHDPSGRRFSVYRQDGQLRMTDELTEVTPYGDVRLGDHVLKYVVGSGHFAKAYLAEIDGFLAEAPLNWFASTGSWGMSPGYEHAAHEGFARPVIERCVTCHAGSAEAVAGTVQKLRFHEFAIGCERCHGPGSVHVDFRSRDDTGVAAGPVAGAIDHTIVNPAHLSRELAEDVCAQCHLTASAEVTARGRTLSEYRPGLPLQDYLLVFRRTDPGSSMTVVGHSDQLALSRCYQESSTLTCITCHNPHEIPDRQDRPAYYRGICLDCHQLPDCRVDPDVRAAQSADNDCVKCHMPVGPTEIIHLAFTHHRIGVHNPAPRVESDPSDPAPVAAAQLESMRDLAHLGEADRERALGLAYYDHAWLEAGTGIDLQLQRAKTHLERVGQLGLQDGQVDAALAQICWFTGDPRAPAFAMEALQDPRLPADPRSGVLSILGTNHLNYGEYQAGAKQAQELLGMRRNAPNWILLANCELKRNNFPAAMAAFEQAVAIDPKQVTARRTLSQLYGFAGRESDARREWAIADRLDSILKGSQTPDSVPGAR